MTPIDHLLFGNGHGLGSPKADVVYYWLSTKERRPEDER